MLYLPLVNRPKTIPGLVYRKSAWAGCSSFQWLWATWVRASTTSPTSCRTASSWTSPKSECPSTSGRWWSYFRSSSYDIFYDFVPIPGSFHLLNQVHYCHFVYRRKIITYSISYMSILYEGYRRIEWQFNEDFAVKNLAGDMTCTRNLLTWKILPAPLFELATFRPVFVWHLVDWLLHSTPSDSTPVGHFKSPVLWGPRTSCL